MRTIVISTCIAVSILSIPASRRLDAAADQGRSQSPDRNRGGDTTERVSRRIRIGANGRVSLANVTGSVVVTGGSGNDVSIEAVKRTRGSRQLLDTVQIDIQERTGRVDIRTIYDDRRRTNNHDDGVSVDYMVTIPSQVSIDVTSISGAVSVSNVKGTVDVKATSGTMTLSGNSRVETAKTISGTIELTDSTLDAEAEITTTSGSIRVRDVKARALQLKTVSGRIEATDLSSERLEMTTLSGRIEMTGRLAKNGRYNLGTHSGSIRLTLSGDPGFDLRASTFSGSIRSDFNMTREQRSGRDDRGRARSSRSLSGTVGDGSAELTIQTFSGSIVLERR